MATTSPQSPDDPTAGLGGPAEVPRDGLRARLRAKPGIREAYRVAVFVAGLLFIALGVALMALPGPLTIPPVLFGLWIWSTEFAFAERFFDAFKDEGRGGLEAREGASGHLGDRHRRRSAARRGRVLGRPALRRHRAREGRDLLAVRSGAMRVGVVVPVHGWAPFLAEALDSVLANEPDAVVVVDDGSREPLALHPDHAPHCTLIRREHNGGVAAARATGEAALADDIDLVASCDADDAWLPGKLAAQLEAIGDAAAAFGSATVVGPDGRASGERWEDVPAGAHGAADLLPGAVPAQPDPDLERGRPPQRAARRRRLRRRRSRTTSRTGTCGCACCAPGRRSSPCPRRASATAATRTA